MAANTTENTSGTGEGSALAPDIVVDLGAAGESGEALTPQDEDVDEFEDDESDQDDPLGEEFQQTPQPAATVSGRQFTDLYGRRRKNGVDGCVRIAPQRWRHESGLILDASGMVVGRS